MPVAYAMLFGERVEEDGRSRYELQALPVSEDFRDAEDYEYLEASRLSVEGVGFSAPAFEFSQHGHRVVVEQATRGGHANISFRQIDE